MKNGFGGVTDLVAEPDYRAVRLSWTCEQSIGLLGFNIRYCEIAHWAMKTRCREQNILLKPEREQIGVDIDEPVIRLHMTGLNRFEAAVTNLRMLTNYSINVWPNYGENSPSFINHDKSIDQLDQLPTFVETKSFAAKTSRCLANTSDIEVQTGPYFRGKISVEGSTGSSCAIYGNRSSEQSVYVLTINHDLCGSKILNNGSRIETMVIVHENREILTHNSRRYMVVCTFTPEVYSLTASVSVPNHLLKKVLDRMREKQFQLSSAVITTNSTRNGSTGSSLMKPFKNKVFPYRRDDEFRSKQSSHLRDSRMLAEDSHAKWVKHVNESTSSFPNDYNRFWLHDKLTIGSMCLIVIMGICLLLAFIKKRSRQNRL